MVKIFLKAAVLVFIILSIYFIVNPSACSNLLAGRVVNTPPVENPQINPSVPPAQEEMLIPAGDLNPQDLPSAQEVISAPAAESAEKEDTSSQQKDSVPAAQEDEAEEQEASASLEEDFPYTQEDIDYAVASRYVELEREYIKENKAMGKESSHEISSIVMDDFEMSPEEWEAFLTRATSSNLFNKVREEMPQ